MKIRRAAQALAVAGVALVAAAPMAGAHVTVDPAEASQGGYTTMNVRVPNESDEASTTKVEINFPTDTPIRSVRVQPKPGWEYEIERTTLDEPIVTDSGDEVTDVVSKVTWSGGEIGPGEFDQFPLSVGPLPEDVELLQFPAIQTYSDGEERRWIDPPPAEGEEEPESPAPAMTLTPAAEEGADTAAADGSEAQATESAASADAATQSDVDGAKTMGIVGIVVGVLGLLVGGFAIVRSRNTGAAAEK